MGVLFRLLELLILILPLIGGLYAALKAFSAYTKRLREEPAGAAVEGPTAPGGPTVSNEAAQWRAITRAIQAHDSTDARWLEYELDISKLLDFPVMTDMREPLTTAFHKAKLRADFHKPVRAEDLLDDREAARQYLDAVEDYVTAFNAAEADAIRRRRSDFSREEQQRIARAQNLLRVAADAGATPQERERAYGLARNELEGLIVLPTGTRESLERGIAGEIDG
ncbi:hypothetical protein [Mycobacterium bourgelatii]|uniref:Uncharacterized protein n=1 Tax=Mycobacterium bourgelatii TaxID=1273442 RepID=A0A7I9YQ50_MYCBU|nr:hypothetical protein [Mycobacterium bourgelatii]MCV6973785.1 hypothetical protein [Mycobacterium bourgelatii]GFG90603.1 hypothetical protein MBOU_26450 [Mycobacterium bourgelatii]